MNKFKQGIKCHSSFVHWGTGSDSDDTNFNSSSEESDEYSAIMPDTPEHNGERQNPESSEGTEVNKTDLATIISLNSRNNYGKVTGLKYFAGGRSKDPENPTLSCTPSVKQWVKDIDARTVDNWTDSGRIQLAKQYALGTAFKLICTTVDAVGLDWSKVKKELLEVFPDDKTYYEKKADLATARRNTGETLSDFWVRLHEAATLLEKERPENKASLQEDKITAFLTALPKHFQSYLTDNDLKDPSTVYKKAMNFVRNNPQLKLTNSDLMKEARQSVAVVNVHKPQAVRYNRREEQRNYNDSFAVCFRCEKPGHIARNCWVEICRSCGMTGHSAATCRRFSAGRRGRNPSNRYPPQGNYYNKKKNAVEKPDDERRVSEGGAPFKGNKKKAIISITKNNLGSQIALNIQVQRHDNTYTKVAALLDTGACVSLMTADFKKELGLQQYGGEAQPVDIASVQGNSIANEGMLEVNLKFGKRKTLQGFVIARDVDMPTPILLGTDFMLQHDIVLKTLKVDKKQRERSWELIIEGESIPIKNIAPGEISLVSRGNESQLNENENEEENLTENDAVRCRAAESLALLPSMAGYVTLVTPLQAEEAFFEPCVSNPEARALCPGIVKVTPSSDNKRSYVTIPYINVETQSIEIAENTTLGHVRTVTREQYVNLPQVCSVQTANPAKINLQPAELDARKKSLY